jgi:hypothetical protein
MGYPNDLRINAGGPPLHKECNMPIVEYSPTVDNPINPAVITRMITAPEPHGMRYSIEAAGQWVEVPTVEWYALLAEVKAIGRKVDVEPAEFGDGATVIVTDVTRLRIDPQTRAGERPKAHIDLSDGRTMEITLAEWREMVRDLSRISGFHMAYRNFGADLDQYGVLVEVIQ